MADIDFQQIMDSFGTPADQGDPIKSIYEIIPHMDAVQMHLLFEVTYFVEKYDLKDWRAVLSSIDNKLKTNKNLSFMSNMNLKSLLAAYTQNELVRGVKVQTINSNQDKGSV